MYYRQLCPHYRGVVPITEQLTTPRHPDRCTVQDFAIWVGFNIVWSVLYEHREYNHSSQTILKHAYITATHFQAVSELAAAWNLRW